MTVESDVASYLSAQPEPKRGDMEALHALILAAMPGCRLWFLDGRNAEGKVVSNPNVGYGARTIDYAGGGSREFYQVGLSANTGGISVYILGIADKDYLARTYGPRLGKASVSGYCIKFRKLKDIDVDVLASAVKDGVRITGGDAAAA